MIVATVLGYVFGDVFGRRLWATVSGDTEIVGFDCGLRFQATVSATHVGYDCGLRLWATVVGYNCA